MTTEPICGHNGCRCNLIDVGKAGAAHDGQISGFTCLCAQPLKNRMDATNDPIDGSSAGKASNSRPKHVAAGRISLE